jgi:hypothetical protein
VYLQYEYGVHTLALSSKTILFSNQKVNGVNEFYSYKYNNNNNFDK